MTATNRSTATPTSPSPGCETPRYRVSRDLHPPAKPRNRFEPPFSMSTDDGAWQYAERPMKAGETIETTAWPHASMIGLNESARRVLEFFRNSPKSRLPLAPWHEGRIRLETGLTGAGPVLETVRSIRFNAAAG